MTYMVQITHDKIKKAKHHTKEGLYHIGKLMTCLENWLDDYDEDYDEYEREGHRGRGRGRSGMRMDEDYEEHLIHSGHHSGNRGRMDY